MHYNQDVIEEFKGAKCIIYNQGFIKEFKGTKCIIIKMLEGSWRVQSELYINKNLRVSIML